MEKSNKQKTIQEDSRKDSQSKASGLLYWDDYDFSVAYLENRNATISQDLKLRYNHDNDGSSDL